MHEEHRTSAQPSVEMAQYGCERGPSQGRVMIVSQTNAETRGAAETWFPAHFHQLRQEDEGIS